MEPAPLSKNQRDYASYLLRLWKVMEHGRATWRASLESTHDNQRLTFSDLEALLSYLRIEFGDEGRKSIEHPVQERGPQRDE
jgi:hypothetical protein